MSGKFEVIYNKVFIILCCFFSIVIVVKIVDINRQIDKQEEIHNELAMYEKNEDGYRVVTQDYLKAVMNKNKSIIIVDVRSEEEYSLGHIPNAIDIPINKVTYDNQEELKSKLGPLKRVIFVYSRNGRDSEKAAIQLAAIGYENVFEIGGIEDWKYEISR